MTAIPALRTAHIAAPIDLDFAKCLLSGLSQPQKSIPSRFFYDERGSGLFEEITRLPEYYPTRTELQILADHAIAIGRGVPDGAALVEFGSGSSRKTEILLDRIGGLAVYVPLDISVAALREAEARLAARYPSLQVLPVVCDFAKPIRLPDEVARLPKLGFFPGSTIGNLTPADAVHLLRNMAGILGRKQRLIIGVDLRKDAGRLVAAYNDSRGVTAEFNLNLLARSNRELGSDFDLAQFVHLATYDSISGRIDMWLVSREDQTAHVLGRPFHFQAGERIHTEISQKYAVGEFRTLARQAGWRPLDAWTDREHLFSVHQLLFAD